MSTALVVGEEGLRHALEARGIAIVGPEQVPDAVVVGWDRSFTYETLRDASIAVQRGAALVATNADATYPAPEGLTWPGRVRSSRRSRRRPRRARRCSASRTRRSCAPRSLRVGGGTPLVIGDRVSTDIEGARRLRWDSMLVLTGISTRDDLETAGIAATYVAEDLSALLEE